MLQRAQRTSVRSPLPSHGTACSAAQTGHALLCPRHECHRQPEPRGSTLVGCGNNQCCNAAWLHLFLTATAPPLSTQSEVQLLEVRAAANKPLCSGNECSVTCEPFDPHAARAFEISGILHAEAHERCPPSGAPPEPCPPPYVRAWLEEVDLSASSRLEGDRDLEDLSRLPIETGSFVVAVKRKSP